ncbi:hypothetical protein M2145_002524 [Lachnospiraceae bacterium PF1-21]
MARVIKPSEIQTQVNSEVSTLEKDSNLLEEALSETQAFSQLDGLQGKAWSGVKSQVSAHDVVIRGLTCMNDAMMSAGKRLVALCGDEDLDEEKLLLQIDMLESMKSSFQNAIESYSQSLKNVIYETCLGWYAHGQIAAYQNLVDTTEAEIRIAKEKLEDIDRIDSDTRNLLGETEQLQQAVLQGMEYLKSAWTGSGFATPAVQNLEWMGILNERWKKMLDRKETERLETLEMYHDSLPDALKPYVELSDLAYTDDGFVICKKSMQDIMVQMGMARNYKISSEDGVQALHYDDWYLAGVMDSKGKLTFTMIKIREPGDDQGSGGTAVPFIALDMGTCSTALGKSASGKQLSEKDKAKLYNAFSDVTNGDGKKNGTLRDYFINPASDGSYLIADCIVDKVVKSDCFDKGGVWEIPYEYSEFDRYAKAYLDDLQKTGIYNDVKNTIRVQDINKLSQDEYNAILTVVTGDTDSYAFAAENQWHAEALRGDLLKNPLGILDDKAIKSDAGVGESKGRQYERAFKSKDGTTYNQQKEMHQ